MRVENWNPNAMDETFENVAIDRLVAAAEVVKDATKRNFSGRIGSGKTTMISRPVYKTGPYAGQPWTKRDFGELGKSIRVVRQKTKSGKAFSKKRNVRVYAGHYLAYYARIFEYSKPFMRPALAQSISEIKSVLGVR